MECTDTVVTSGTLLVKKMSEDSVQEVDVGAPAGAVPCSVERMVITENRTDVAVGSETPDVPDGQCFVERVVQVLSLEAAVGQSVITKGVRLPGSVPIASVFD